MAASLHAGNREYLSGYLDLVSMAKLSLLLVGSLVIAIAAGWTVARHVTSLEVPSSCFVDTVMKIGQTGTLTFPCEGDGEARLAFGTKSFAGASIGGRFDMCTGTEYPFVDGCRWTSAQRVTGRLGAQDLAFKYGEAPKVGTQKQCAAACSASGTVHVK